MSRPGCAIVVALALAASACASAQARSEPGGPALAPPVPPPHAIVPVEIVEEPAAPPAVSSPAPAPVGRSQRQGSPKPQRPPEKSDPAADPVPPAAPPPAPPLQTTTDVEGMKTAIRKTMEQARVDLDRTANQSLTPERRAQHDTAKRFLEQAGEALKGENLVFAEQMANKAATLAAALAQK